jgi:hypothetical protein
VTAITKTTVCLALLATCLLPAGCRKSSGPAILPAGGVVTYHKQPLANVVVTFHPKSGRPATATTDASGHFRLSTLRANDGAVVGPHKVSISMVGPPPMPGSIEAQAARPKAPALPAKFSNPETSGLTATVEDGSPNTFPLDLRD